MSENMHELDVVGIRFEEPDYSPVLVLKESGGPRYLPVWIGAAEAAAISLHQQGVEPARPLTHDLLVDVIERCGRRVQGVEIVGLDQGTFFAELVLDDGARISARPSDAIAVAVRVDVPVRVTEQVLGEAGLDLGAPGEEEVEAFREFLDGVSADDFLSEGGGPHEPGGSDEA